MNRKSFIQEAAMLSLLPWANGEKTIKSQADDNTPKLGSPSLHNSYWYIGHLMSILISSQDTGGAFSLIHGFEIQGLEPPPHMHTKEDESFYLISGEIDYIVGERVLHAKTGDWVFLPRNVQHSFQVKTPQAEVLIHLSPGGFENYFIAMSEPAKQMVNPPKPQGLPNVQKIVETASQYGIVFPKR